MFFGWSLVLAKLFDFAQYAQGYFAVAAYIDVEGGGGSVIEWGAQRAWYIYALVGHVAGKIYVLSLGGVMRVMLGEKVGMHGGKHVLQGLFDIV